MSYNVRNLHDNRPICPFRHVGHAVEGGAHYHPIAAWIPSRDSVDAMVRFHSEVTILNYDGICKQHDIYIYIYYIYIFGVDKERTFKALVGSTP